MSKRVAILGCGKIGEALVAGLLSSGWREPGDVVVTARRQERADELRERSRLSTASGIDLYWLPLGAGGHSVRLNGRVYEAVAARLGRRDPCDLYHAGLEIHAGGGRYVLEQAPAWGPHSREGGVIAEGAVGAQWAGRYRLFRYEVRCWRDGTIPDVAEAVDSPRRLTGDAVIAQRALDLAPRIPTAVWGRDHLRTGEMWNSNSVVSWLLASCGLDAESILPPAGGRAPGWRAGIVVARRQPASTG